MERDNAFFRSKTFFKWSNHRLQRDSSSDRWSRRQPSWPLDHHHHHHHHGLQFSETWVLQKKTFSSKHSRARSMLRTGGKGFSLREIFSFGGLGLLIRQQKRQTYWQKQNLVLRNFGEIFTNSLLCVTALHSWLQGPKIFFASIQSVGRADCTESCRIPSCGPRCNSLAHHLCFFNLYSVAIETVFDVEMRKDEYKQKRTGLTHI